MGKLDTGTEDLRAEIDDGVAVITMNRPDRRNAFSPAMISALGTALAQVEADEAVGCLSIPGQRKGNGCGKHSPSNPVPASHADWMAYACPSCAVEYAFAAAVPTRMMSSMTPPLRISHSSGSRQPVPMPAQISSRSRLFQN